MILHQIKGLSKLWFSWYHSYQNSSFIFLLLLNSVYYIIQLYSLIIQLPLPQIERVFHGGEWSGGWGRGVEPHLLV